MKLRVTLAFGNYRKGDLIDPPALQAQDMLAMRCFGRPIVERVVEALAAVATVLPPAEPEPRPLPPRHRRREFS